MKRIWFLSFLMLVSLSFSACGSDISDNLLPPEERENPGGEDSSDNPENVEDMEIKMTIGGQVITVTMENNAAARDFISRLPLEITLNDFNNTEKIFYPEPKLNIEGVGRGCTPVAGDITIYVPWGNVAIFYKGWSQSNSLIKIGHIDGDGINILSAYSGDVHMKIEKN